jgi:hypothetical protein
MEDRGRHRIGISQNQPHINAHVAPQLYNCPFTLRLY